MAKITIVGDVMVVTSSKTLEDIKVLEKYKPKALSLYEMDAEGKAVEIFRVASTEDIGSISKYGASFGSVAHDGTGLATITLPLPSGVEDVKEYAADKIGYAVANLSRVEAQFDAALDEIKAERAVILQNITVA